MNDLRAIQVNAIVLAAALWLMSGCDNQADHHAAVSNHDHHDAHHHTAPHGGALVAIGDHVAHVECVFDADEGRVTLYLLDGDADRSERVEHQTLQLAFSTVGDEPVDFTLTLHAVESRLTGETVGDSSQFEAADDRLRGAERFAAELTAIRIRGQRIEAIEIRYPDGNESHGT